MSTRRYRGKAMTLPADQNSKGVSVPRNTPRKKKSLPLTAYARCNAPGCGKLVFVIKSNGNELHWHRRPDGKPCETGRHVRGIEIIGYTDRIENNKG